MKWVYDDGGRTAAGYKGEAGDCVYGKVIPQTDRCVYGYFVKGEVKQ